MKELADTNKQFNNLSNKMLDKMIVLSKEKHMTWQKRIFQLM